MNGVTTHRRVEGLQCLFEKAPDGCKKSLQGRKRFSYETVGRGAFRDPYSRPVAGVFAEVVDCRGQVGIRKGVGVWRRGTCQRL